MKTALPETEAAAWSDYRSGRNVAMRNRLVEMYQPLARSVARRSLDYARSISPAAVDLDDLESIAAEGLISAVERFEPDRGVPFKYYARLRVSGHIKDALRRYDYLTRRSRQQVSAWLDGRSDDLSEEQKRTAGRLSSQRPLPTPEGPAELDSQQPQSSLPDQVEDEAIKPVLVNEILDTLSPPERAVIECRYLHGMSLSAIGVLLGVTESRACQIHLTAMRRLRESPEI